MDASNEQPIEVQLRDCAGHEIRLIRLPESRPPLRKWWVFCRQLECLIFGTAANSSNLLHDLEQLELVQRVRHYRMRTH